MALKTIHQAEQLHALGEAGTRRVARWLDSTARFAISHTAYDLDPGTGVPTDHCRVELMDGTHETFDLFGALLTPAAKYGDRIFVECKNYSSAGNQGTLYREYLAICYSAFHRRWEAANQEPNVQFMWATNHPFSIGDWGKLCHWESIEAACSSVDHLPRLGNGSFDRDVAEALASRLWLSVVNGRVEEMMMGDHLMGALKSAMVTIGA